MSLRQCTINRGSIDSYKSTSLDFACSKRLMNLRLFIYLSAFRNSRPPNHSCEPFLYPDNSPTSMISRLQAIGLLYDRGTSPNMLRSIPPTCLQHLPLTLFDTHRPTRQVHSFITLLVRSKQRSRCKDTQQQRVMDDATGSLTNSSRVL